MLLGRYVQGLLLEALHRYFIVGEYEGILISDAHRMDEEWLEIIKCSIRQIKKIDPRRYKIVLRELHWIVNSYGPDRYGGQYQVATKACLINYISFSDDKRFVSLFYAGILVHEATHGLLYRKRFEYTKKDRLQIERICTAEENRFYRKVECEHPDYKNTLIKEFNPSGWEYAWETPRWKKMYHALRRLYGHQND